MKISDYIAILLTMAIVQIASLAFAKGYVDASVEKARCPTVQQGERLAYSVTNGDTTTCAYAQGYGRGIRKETK